MNKWTILQAVGGAQVIVRIRSRPNPTEGEPPNSDHSVGKETSSRKSEK